MAGIADMLFGGGAQTYAVPDPSASMADILAGGVANATPSSGGASIATAFGDSPAPGGVAAAGAQANAAASQEPGILDRARSWATTNPVQAQALMQGFAALASGRTRGGFVNQIGQAAGVAGQTMVEQNAANAALQREQQVKDRDFGLRQREADSTIGSRDSMNRRADALLPGQLEAQDLAAEGADQRIRQGEQTMQQSDKMFTPKMQLFKKQLDKLDSDISSAKTEREAAQQRLKRAKLETDIYAKFGEEEAATILGTKQQTLANAQEQGTQEVLRTDQMVQSAAELAKLTPEQRSQHVLGLKPKVEKTDRELAEEFLTKEPDRYMNRDGSINYDALGGAVRAVKQGGTRPAATQEAWVAARNKVKVGQKYVGPDGQEYLRKQ